MHQRMSKPRAFVALIILFGSVGSVCAENAELAILEGAELLRSLSSPAAPTLIVQPRASGHALIDRQVDGLTLETALLNDIYPKPTTAKVLYADPTNRELALVTVTEGGASTATYLFFGKAASRYDTLSPWHFRSRVHSLSKAHCDKRVLEIHHKSGNNNSVVLVVDLSAEDPIVLRRHTGYETPRTEYRTAELTIYSHRQELDGPDASELEGTLYGEVHTETKFDLNRLCY